MKASARWHWIYRVHGWCAAMRPAGVCTLSGATLALATFTLGFVDAPSVPLMFTLALASAALTLAGLIHILASDSRAAWRRGFRLGCSVGMLGLREGVRADSKALPRQPSQLGVHDAPPTARRGSHA